jgi:predicted Rossmann fold nucleotide-binding protein DprA/Smf involved in DNA uptake
VGEKVAIVGSRDWADHEAVTDYVNSLNADDIVISGGAPGVDTITEIAAIERGLAFLKFPAKWDQYGRIAGALRNRDIAKACDRLVAFWTGSRGTAITVQMAKDLGKPVIVFNKGSRQLDGFIREVEGPMTGDAKHDSGD